MNVMPHANLLVREGDRRRRPGGGALSKTRAANTSDRWCKEARPRWMGCAYGSDRSGARNRRKSPVVVGKEPFVANHQYILEIVGGTRQQADAFIQALFYDGANPAPTMVGELLDKHINMEAGVIVR